MSPFRKEVILVVGMVFSLLLGCGTSKEEAARSSIQKGDTFFQNRLYSDALSYYEGALEALPTDAQLHLKIGMCRQNLKRHDDAIRSFEIAMRQDPNLSEAYQRKGDLLIETNKLVDASSFADEVVAREGKESVGFYLLGKISAAKRDYAAAIEHFENSLEFDADYTPTQEALVEAYRMSDQTQPAIALIETLLEKKPGDISLTAQLAFLYEHEGNTERAISLIAKLINDHPENGRLRSALARLYLTDGRYDLAEAENRTALSLDPDDPVALYVSGMLALQNGDLDRAYEDLKAAQERLPADDMIQKAFRDIQIARGKIIDPIKTLKQRIAESGESPALAVQLADAYLFIGDAAMSLSELEEVLGKDPGNKGAMIVQAHALLSLGNRSAAAQVLEQIGESDDPRVQVMRGILDNDAAAVTAAVEALKSQETTLSWGRYFSGVYKLVSGQIEGGIEELQEAYDQDETFGMPMDELGRLYMSLNELEISLGIYQNQLAFRFPESTRPRMMIARLYDRMGETEKALVALNGLLELHPDFQPAQFFVATLYLKQQKFDLAKEIFTDLIEQTKDDPISQIVFRGVLAKTLLFAQEYAQAVEQYNKILEFRPDFPVAMVEKSLAQMADDNPVDALATAAAALESATEKLIPAIVHSILLQQNGKVVEALAEMEKVAREVESEPGKKEDLVPILAGLRMSAGEFDSAREAVGASNRPQIMKDIFLDAIDHAERNKVDFTTMPIGLLFGYYNWPDPAIAVHRRLLTRNPQIALLVANLGEVLQQAGRDQEAYDVYADATRWAPDNVYFIRTKAKLASRLGKHREAMEDLLRVAARDPSDPALQFQLGTVYEKQSLREEAIGTYETILQMQAGDMLMAAASNNLAWLYSQDSSRLDEALVHAEKALELSPANPRTGGKDGNILDTAGWIHYQKGNLDEALKHIGQATRVLPFHPTILYHLGRVYEDKGEIEAAKFQYMKALRNNPDFEESRDTRQRLQAILHSEPANPKGADSTTN